MLAPALFLSGLLLVAVATGFLAGLWWGVLLAGAVLAALGVLTAAQDRRPTAKAPEPAAQR